MKEVVGPRLQGRVAIVTGGGVGIGRHYCLALAAQGAKVCVADVASTDATVMQIVASGGNAFGLEVDITRQETVDEMVRATELQYGRVDILVNNAGIFSSIRMTAFDQITETDWERVMTVNVRGTWQVVKAAVPAMERAGGGSIINVSSATVFKGSPLLLHYVASKGAVVALTRSLARELGPKKIRVNAIAPGLVMSEHVITHADWGVHGTSIVGQRALSREAMPEDMVGAVSFLASDESSFMTGQTLVVDGGIVLH
jgi:NAD(P)-dependent dehydrogenase (short-subunit alcohol dehydrogenase family)